MVDLLFTIREESLAGSVESTLLILKPMSSVRSRGRWSGREWTQQAFIRQKSAGMYRFLYRLDSWGMPRASSKAGNLGGLHT